MRLQLLLGADVILRRKNRHNHLLFSKVCVLGRKLYDNRIHRAASLVPAQGFPLVERTPGKSQNGADKFYTLW